MEMLTEVTAKNSKSSAAKDFQSLSLPELITHILDKHHVFTRTEMARLEALTAKVIGAHGENHPELIHLGELFKLLCADLRPHMFKEEQVLFPYILSMTEAKENNEAGPFAPFGTVNNPIRMMMREHDNVGEILRELRALTSDYEVPADACISYRTLYQALDDLEKDLHQHIHLENNILFPRALELETTLNR
jgi:regulator of cell morphogenesis and NO signaling